MTDREKVVKELHDARRYLEDKEWSDRGASPHIDAINDALILLKGQKWNLLKEDADGVIHGLPGDDGQYLMTDGKDIWIDDYVDGVADGIILDSGSDIREITAWMYMPELPKKDRR